MPDPTPRDPMPPAAHTGTHGAAWRCNRPAALRAHGIKPAHCPIIADWIVQRADSHAVWHSWHIALLHLRPLYDEDTPELILPGATHELCVTAMDPFAPRADAVQGRALANHHHIERTFAAQITEPTDQAAITRIAATIDLIVQGTLNPESLTQWISLFGDAMLVPAGGAA